MIGMTITMRSFIPKYVAMVNEETDDKVRESIERIERGCKAKSRVDTGQMRDGWSSEMIEHDTGRVYNEVVHTAFNEYGTIYMSAQPMLRPSVEEEKPEYIDEVKDAWRVADFE